jgi:hypothetical protein
MHTVSALSGEVSQPTRRQRDQMLDILDALAVGLLDKHGLEDGRFAAVNDAIAVVADAPTEAEALAVAEACVLGLLRAPAGGAR